MSLKKNVEAGRVVSANSLRSAASEKLFEGDSGDGGVTRLERWAEGYVLWHNGLIVWKSADWWDRVIAHDEWLKRQESNADDPPPR